MKKNSLLLISIISACCFGLTSCSDLITSSFIDGFLSSNTIPVESTNKVSSSEESSNIVSSSEELSENLSSSEEEYVSSSEINKPT